MITTFPLRLVIRAPFATRSSETGGIGVDLPLARSADGRVMIPGTHVLGKIAHATRELCGILGDDPLAAEFDCDLVELLADNGALPSIDQDLASDGREARRSLTASDFVLQTAEHPTGSRTRIAIDNVTSTVLDGMLQVVEQPFAPREELVFQGNLRAFGTVLPERRARLLKALAFITQFGALRSVGFGELVRVEDAAEPERPKMLVPTVGEAGKVLMRLAFEDVFCAGEARNTPNTYTSADHVPGGVIKGAIARQMLASVGRHGFLDDAVETFHGDLAVLARSFSDVGISHAQPVEVTGSLRAFRAIPDSLAAIEGPDEEICIIDLAGLEDPSAAVLINGQVPLAPFDWKEKHFAAANDLLGIASGPGRVLRIRTQIDENSRSAMTSRLFGVEYTRGDQHDFLAEVDLSGCDDPQAVLRGLGMVLDSGLLGIGRGGAFASVTLATACSHHAPAPGRRAVAVLQTPALLRDPGDKSLDLAMAYGDAFAELGLPQAWRLISVFARERLAGGGFFFNRFAGKGKAYAPWLLTEPGATFVFECGADGVHWPEDLFKRGLQVPASVKIHHGIEKVPDLYRVCPYLPENGYGELIVDPFRIRSRPLWEVRSPSALGLEVEPAGDFGRRGQG